jgi:hypothetical protein
MKTASTLPRDHYRLCARRRGSPSGEVEDPAARLWLACAALAAIDSRFGTLAVFDPEMAPFACNGPADIEVALAIWQIPWGDERRPTDPSHRVRIATGGVGAEFADLLAVLWCDSGALWLEARLGTAIDDDPQRDRHLEAMLLGLVRPLGAGRGLVETPRWPEPAGSGTFDHQYGWLTYLAGPWELVDAGEVTSKPVDPPGLLVTATPQAIPGDSTEMTVAIRRVEEAMARARLAGRPPPPVSAAAPRGDAAADAHGIRLEPVAAFSETAPAKPAGPAGAAVPFRRGAHRAAPAAVASSLEPHPEMGATTRATTSTSPELPFRGAPAAGAEPQLSLEHYASLVAECAVWPDARAAIRGRYGLTDVAHDQVEGHFNRRFAEDPALHGRFLGLFVRYRDWLKSQAR